MASLVLKFVLLSSGTRRCSSPRHIACASSQSALLKKFKIRASKKSISQDIICIVLENKPVSPPISKKERKEETKGHTGNNRTIFHRLLLYICRLYNLEGVRLNVLLKENRIEIRGDLIKPLVESKKTNTETEIKTKTKKNKNKAINTVKVEGEGALPCVGCLRKKRSGCPS